MHELAVPEVFDLCQKVRAEVKKFKYSEKEVRALIRQINLRPHMKNLHVILDSPAEWSTTVKMLSRMSQLEDAYLAYAEEQLNPWDNLIQSSWYYQTSSPIRFIKSILNQTSTILLQG